MKYEHKFTIIKTFANEGRGTVQELCGIADVSRAGYYKWLHHSKSMREIENEALIPLICEAYEERDGILGYRQMTIKLNREHGQRINHKRVYRLMRIIGLKSVCRKKRYSYKKSTPEVVAENVLNRNFKAERPCEKWLTDVTEFKYGDGQKAYLSAIFDLGDRSIISYVIGQSNNNTLVFDTFDQAVATHPTAKPIFHSDRGYQYTNKTFKAKLDEAGMVQSMSRVSRCIDNGPMEGFWGILKSEMYYLRKFNTYDNLVTAIHDYIDYYNNKRYQKRLCCMSPLEFRSFLYNFAA